MPNWCSNTFFVTGPADVAAQLRAIMTTQRSRFDFNAVLPMPEALRQSESGTASKTAWELKYGDWAEVKWKYGPDCFDSREAALAAAREADDWRPSVYATPDQPLRVRPPRSFDELADAVQQLVDKCGYPDWYEWAVANWGTKWPASDAGWMSAARAAKRDAQQVAYFGTAWCPPIPVVASLSERFPDTILRLEYCEPDCGFRGFLAMQAGVEIASKHEHYDVYAESICLSHNIRDTRDHRPLIYIGPGRQADADGPAFSRSPWANPFADGSRDNQESCQLFRRWLLGDVEMIGMMPTQEHLRPSLDDIREQLLGTTLLCDCRNGDAGCHGHVLMDIAFGRDDDDDDFANDDRDDNSSPVADFVARGIGQ